MPRKKRRVEPSHTPEKEMDHVEMHEKNKITIDVQKYRLEEIALLLGEFFQAHDQYNDQRRKTRPL